MFRSCENKGFHIEFRNGFRVSCQFGVFSYCSNRSLNSEDIHLEMKVPIWECSDCEVAIINSEEEFVTGEIFERMGLNISNDGMVAGWVNADEVAKIITYVSGLERQGKEEY